MSVNSICQSIAISCYKGEELSTSTKLRLEALGIDPNTIKTEAEAKIVISQAEAAKKESNQQHKNPTNQQLIFEAKNLANKVGVSFSEKKTFKKNLQTISNRIQTIAMDPQRQEEAKIYEKKLLDIAFKADVVIKTQQFIFDNMNMISISNKLLLGL